MPRIAAALFAAFLTLTTLPVLAGTTGIVRGTVFVNDKPTAGVSVTLRGEGSLMQRTTDQSGAYVFPQVPFGTYTIAATYAGVPSFSQQIQVASDQVVSLNIQLGQLKTISASTVRAGAGVGGYPVSVNALTKNQIDALPINNSLNRLVETVPGIVRFSYNEPVAHGFHGVNYEIDGAPLPLATSSNFAEIIDPKNIDSMEIFTGAMPAEFGGTRQGAVINIISNRPSDLTVPYQGYLTAGGGNFSQGTTSFDNAFKTGKTEIFLNANTQRNARGLDAPTFDAINDETSQSDEFLRSITTFNDTSSLAFDFSNQLAQFEIPINTNPSNIFDPQFSVPGTNDSQREYDRFASLNYTLSSKSGNSVFQFIPWTRYTRIAYNGDLNNDVLGLTNLGPCGNLSPVPSFCTDPNAPAYQSGIGLNQNRVANYVGIRTSELLTGKHHSVKFGLDANREILTASQTFACYDSSCSTLTGSYPIAPPSSPYFTTTNQDQAGTQVGLYAQDKWTPSQALSVSYGLRYDHSTGYVSGHQISPRIGVNWAPGRNDTIHAYYGRNYAAPQLEDVRQACVVLQGCSGTPVYDLQPQTDSYAEIGYAHTFGPRFTAYANEWTRNVSNVLDTTQLLNTPLFAVYNNSIGRAHGTELRLQETLPSTDSWYLSGSWSNSQAAGISGSTFLFPTGQGGTTQELINQLQPEDHNQAIDVNAAYTHRYGENKAYFATLQADYGTGYPVSFQGLVNGVPVGFTGNLPSHTTLNFSFGRDPGHNGDHSAGFSLDVDNLLNDQYTIKIANGFNTTQISQGMRVLFRVTQPL